MSSMLWLECQLGGRRDSGKRAGFCARPRNAAPDGLRCLEFVLWVVDLSEEAAMCHGDA